VSTTTVAPGAKLVFDDAALARVLDKIENAVVRATVGELDVYLSVIGDSARVQWYQQVDRKTGKSGDISGGVTTVTETRIRAVIGSSDTRKEKGKSVLFFIRRPGPLSTKRRLARENEKERARQEGRPVPKYITYPNPKASDGAYLVAELINKPANEGKRELRKAIKAQIRANYRSR
jgi:hypothetical protein